MLCTYISPLFLSSLCLHKKSLISSLLYAIFSLKPFTPTAISLSSSCVVLSMIFVFKTLTIVLSCIIVHIFYK